MHFRLTIFLNIIMVYTYGPRYGHKLIQGHKRRLIFFQTSFQVIFSALALWLRKAAEHKAVFHCVAVRADGKEPAAPEFRVQLCGAGRSAGRPFVSRVKGSARSRKVRPRQIQWPALSRRLAPAGGTAMGIAAADRRGR